MHLLADVASAMPPDFTVGIINIATSVYLWLRVEHRLTRQETICAMKCETCSEEQEPLKNDL
jgi:hypothetical protein